MAVEGRVLVPCELCGIKFDVSARTARNIAAGRSLARCSTHRVKRPRPATIQADHRRFWLKRFTLDEINWMAHAMFDDIRPGEAHASPAVMALIATARNRTPAPREMDPSLVERAREARRRVASG